mmetsp:Transcript_89824/g.290716  ORF Transcript_89824/g.290716 Transcript_89824/m.290716 type:complete len:211 (+) Transcript_89824:1127-1759(+)
MPHGAKHEALRLHGVLVQGRGRPLLEGQGREALAHGRERRPRAWHMPAESLQRLGIGELHQLQQVEGAHGHRRPLQRPLQEPLALLGRHRGGEARAGRPQERPPGLGRGVQHHAELGHSRCGRRRAALHALGCGRATLRQRGREPEHGLRIAPVALGQWAASIGREARAHLLQRCPRGLLPRGRLPNQSSPSGQRGLRRLAHVSEREETL